MLSCKLITELSKVCDVDETDELFFWVVSPNVGQQCSYEIPNYPSNLFLSGHLHAPLFLSAELWNPLALRSFTSLSLGSDASLKKESKSKSPKNGSKHGGSLVNRLIFDQRFRFFFADVWPCWIALRAVIPNCCQ